MLNLHLVLTQALGQAVRCGYMGSNPPRSGLVREGLGVGGEDPRSIALDVDIDRHSRLVAAEARPHQWIRRGSDVRRRVEGSTHSRSEALSG